jgi:elongation factor P
MCADVAAPFLQAVPLVILVSRQTKFRGVGYWVFDCVAWLPAQDLKVLYFSSPYCRTNPDSSWSRIPMKASDIRRGHVIFFQGQPCRVMEFTHRTPGNLRAFVQARMRNLNSGSTFEHRFSATEFVEEARLDTKQLQVMYRDANGVHVMDSETYEQYTIDAETAGEQAQWLESGVTFQADWLNGRPISIELPSVAELEVVETAPVMKTATKTASTKPAKLSNGVTIQVPEFISEGERVRVNPRDGAYLERAK